MEKFRKIMLCPCRHLKKVAVDPKIIGLWIDKKLQNLFMYQFAANNTMFLAPAKVWCVRSLLLRSCRRFPCFCQCIGHIWVSPKYRRGLKMSPPGLMMYLVYSLTEADGNPGSYGQWDLRWLEAITSPHHFTDMFERRIHWKTMENNVLGR